MLVLVAPVASKALKVVVIATLNVFAAVDSSSFFDRLGLYTANIKHILDLYLF